MTLLLQVCGFHDSHPCYSDIMKWDIMKWVEQARFILWWCHTRPGTWKTWPEQELADRRVLPAQPRPTIGWAQVSAGLRRRLQYVYTVVRCFVFDACKDHAQITCGHWDAPDSWTELPDLSVSMSCTRLPIRVHLPSRSPSSNAAAMRLDAANSVPVGVSSTWIIKYFQRQSWYSIAMHYIAQQISEQIELPAKLLDYFVWSHKSNIDQCYLDRWQRHTVEVSLIHHFCPLIDFPT